MHSSHEIERVDTRAAGDLSSPFSSPAGSSYQTGGRGAALCVCDRKRERERERDIKETQLGSVEEQKGGGGGGGDRTVWVVCEEETGMRKS